MKRTSIFIPDYMLALRYLNTVEEKGFTDLVRALDVDYNYLYRAVRDMTEAGFLKKRKDEGRTTFYSLTEKGTEIALAIDMVFEAIGINEENLKIHMEKNKVKTPAKQDEEPEPPLEIPKPKEKVESEVKPIIPEIAKEPEPEPEPEPIEPEIVKEPVKERPAPTSLDELEDELVKMDKELINGLEEDEKEILTIADDLDDEENERDPYGEEE